MKRLCLILAFLFLFSQTATAMPLLVGKKVVYRGTVTGLRISSVDGTAFIDNAGETIPTYADGKHTITIYDASGRMLRGYLKAAGSAETLGDEMITTFNNSGTHPYETFTLSGIDINSAINSTGYGSCNSNNITQNVGVLLLYAYNLTLNSGGQPKYYYRATVISIDLLNGSNQSYATMTLSGTRALYVDVYSVSNFILTGNSLKQVLTPSTAGATVVSTKEGTTYNFAYKNASFTYNAASYYVIVKEER
jgi:hypothetical protein